MSARRSTPVRRSRWDWVDVSVAARGASRGFTILVIGGLSVPLVGTLFPPLGMVWLTVTSVAAFLVAALNAGGTPSPARQGALNAVCAYLLVLPLVLLASTDPAVTQIAATSVVAVVTGSVTGWIRARFGAG